MSFLSSVTKVFSDRPGAIPLVYFIIIIRFDKRIQQRQPKLKLYKLFLSEKNGTEQMHEETCWHVFVLQLLTFNGTNIVRLKALQYLSKISNQIPNAALINREISNRGQQNIQYQSKKRDRSMQL